MVLARQVENCCDLAFPYLLRGELLLKRDPSNPAPVEEAFQTALSIAKEQGARNWGLRAAKRGLGSSSAHASSEGRAEVIRKMRAILVVSWLIHNMLALRGNAGGALSWCRAAIVADRLRISRSQPGAGPAVLDGPPSRLVGQAAAPYDRLI